MKKGKIEQHQMNREDEDTMRPEYDFTSAKRGVTVSRYLQGTNVVLLDADVVRMFPNAIAVNEALRALGGILQKVPRTRNRKPKPSVS